MTCFLCLLPAQLLGLPKNWISKPGTLLSLRVESLIPPGHAVTLNNLWEFQGRRSILRGNHIWAARSNLFLEVRENVNRGCCCYCVDSRLLFALSSYCYPSMLHAWFYFWHSYVSMPGSTGNLIYLWWYRYICNLKTLLVYHGKSSRCGLCRKRDDGRHAALTSFRALSSSGVTESVLFSQAARSRSQTPAAAASSVTFFRHVLMMASDYTELKQRFFKTRGRMKSPYFKPSGEKEPEDWERIKWLSSTRNPRTLLVFWFEQSQMKTVRPFSFYTQASCLITREQCLKNHSEFQCVIHTELFMWERNRIKSLQDNYGEACLAGRELTRYTWSSR